MQGAYRQLRSRIIKVSLVVAALLWCNIGHGQVLVLDATGRPIMPKEYVNLKGSPYLYDDWVKGTVRLANGIEYKDIYLMYDQVKEELNFTYKDGKVQKFVDPVAQFTLEDRKFRRDLIGENNSLVDGFYEVLVDGEIKLLKRSSKRIVDELTHAVATKERRIQEVTSQYLLIKGELVKVKDNKNAVIKALGTHKAALEAYIQKENLKMKDEQDMVKLITYFNSLN